MILDSNIIIYSNKPGFRPLIAWLNRPTITFSVSAISQIEVPEYHRLTIQDKEDFDDFFLNTNPTPSQQK